MESAVIDGMLADIGDGMRKIRLMRNLSQQTVADRSGVSLKAVKNLESGAGVSLRSFLAVCRTLDKTGWVQTIPPPGGESPLEAWKRLHKPQRQRAGVSRRGGRDGV